MEETKAPPPLDVLIDEVGALPAGRNVRIMAIMPGEAAFDDILHRMRRHQDKKRPMLRRLHLASAFAAAAPP